MYKNYVFSVTMLLLSSLYSANSLAVTIADVGGVDSFLASANLASSGDQAEEDWVESVLGFDVDLSDKYGSGGDDWMLVDGYDDVYALMTQTSPAYFLIKLGVGNTGTSHYLFQNMFELAWAVIDLSDAGIDVSVRSVGINKMSHVDEFNGNTSIPEPVSLLLLGLGLLGLGARRKRL